MNNERVIFLDVDGVICLYPLWQTDWRGNQNELLNERCCRNLKDILEETNAKIVLTSSWRLDSEHLNSLAQQLSKYGIALEGFGKTNDLSACNANTHNELRWMEINEYITKNAVANYIILDDFNLERFDKEHLVRTKKHEGITLQIKEVCIRKLLG